MKKLLIIFLMLVFTNPSLAQWQVGVDLWRLPTKTLDVGANYFFGKKYFVSIRSGYAFNKNATIFFRPGNLERSSISGYFWAAGLGLTFPSKNKSQAYFGTEVMGDIASREYVYAFSGIHGTHEVKVLSDFKTIGGNVYLGVSNPLAGNLYLDAQIRINTLVSDYKKGDRIVAPSIGKDKFSGDAAFAVNVNFVLKLVYRFAKIDDRTSSTYY